MERELSITYMSGPLDGKTIRFEQPDAGDELILNIGRREGCDIHMPYDNQIIRSPACTRAWAASRRSLPLATL
jgi:hypothetical protein